jgi:hypothetical protein
MDDVIQDVRREVLVLIEGFKKGNEVYYHGQDELVE